jgi:Tfp pilus assembly protein PilP
MIPRAIFRALVLALSLLGIASADETHDPFAPPTAPRVAGTPLERVDVDQIRLVALVDDGKVPRALVEDAGGIGYVVRVGTPIGPRGGVVVAVEPGTIRIREPDADDDIVLPLRTASEEER